MSVVDCEGTKILSYEEAFDRVRVGIDDSLVRRTHQMQSIRFIACVLAIFVTAGFAMGHPAGQAEPTRQQLEKWLREYPEADVNQDGELTVDEATRYRRRLLRPRTEETTPPDYDFRTQFAFATMSDGVKIALAVGFPRDWILKVQFADGRLFLR